MDAPRTLGLVPFQRHLVSVSEKRSATHFQSSANAHFMCHPEAVNGCEVSQPQSVGSTSGLGSDTKPSALGMVISARDCASSVVSGSSLMMSARPRIYALTA